MKSIYIYKVKGRKPTLLEARLRRNKECNKARTTPHGHEEEKEAMRERERPGKRIYMKED